MKMRLTALATLIVALTAGGVSGQMDCPEITDTALENVIMNNIPTGDSPATPTVDVLNFHPVCLAYSQERDRYRYVSVVVEYTCTGNADCPSGNVTEQFDSQCSSGTWSHIVAGSPDNVRTMNPTANFLTTTREDCAFCFSPGTASGLSLTTDDITHCVACNSSCNEGLMRCYGLEDTQCCQYYNDSTCFDTCPTGRGPDSDFNCVCPSGYTGYNCLQACTTYCSICDSDPIICDVCEDGYILQGDECKCTVRNCSKCDADPDICEECAGGHKLSNNQCICPVDNCDDCASDVTKCDQCSTGYTFDITISQCTPECTVNNCSKCLGDPDICDECAVGYKLSENECKCPVDNCDDCAGDVTKCDQCSSEYPIFDNRSSQCTAECPVDNCEICISDVTKCDKCGTSSGSTETSVCSFNWALLAVTIVLAVLVVLLAAALVAALIAVYRLRHTIRYIPTQENVAYLEMKPKKKGNAPGGTTSPPIYETVKEK